MCLRFVCKQSDENHSVHGCLFLRSFFSTFSVCDDCILKSTTARLLKLSALYIHSFKYTTFQIKTVFNNVLFSTEVETLACAPFGIQSNSSGLNPRTSSSSNICHWHVTCPQANSEFAKICLHIMPIQKNVLDILKTYWSNGQC